MKKLPPVPIKDYLGLTLGYLEDEVDDKNNVVRRTATNFLRQKLGVWEKATNHTKNFITLTVTRGDSTAGLILMDWEKKKIAELAKKK